MVVGVPFAGALREMSGALVDLLGPTTSVAMVSADVVIGARVVRGGAALAVLAASGVPASASWLAPGEPIDSVLNHSTACPVLTPGRHHAPSTVAVVSDPISVAAPDLLPAPQHDRALLGGNLAAGSEFRLVVGHEEHRDGSVVVEWHGDAPRAVLSHATMPIAEPMTVTSCYATTLSGLDDLPAAEAFEAAVDGADEALLAGATEVGLKPIEGSELVAVRRAPGGLETSRVLATGDVLAPAVRSPGAAAAELTALIGPDPSGSGSGHQRLPAAALCFLDAARPVPRRPTATPRCWAHCCAPTISESSWVGCTAPRHREPHYGEWAVCCCSEELRSELRAPRGRQSPRRLVTMTLVAATRPTPNTGGTR